MTGFDNYLSIRGKFHSTFYDDVGVLIVRFESFRINTRILQERLLTMIEAKNCSRFSVIITSIFRRNLKNIYLEFYLSHKTSVVEVI